MTTAPAPAEEPNRLTSIEEAEVHGTYWVYARHHVREVRVVAKARTRVHVAFWLAWGTRSQMLQIQAVPYFALRREKPAPTRQYGFLLSWPAPTVEQIAAAVAAIR